MFSSIKPLPERFGGVVGSANIPLALASIELTLVSIELAVLFVELAVLFLELALLFVKLALLIELAALFEFVELLLLEEDQEYCHRSCFEHVL